MPYICTVTWTAKPGSENTMLGALLELAPLPVESRELSTTSRTRIRPSRECFGSSRSTRTRMPLRHTKPQSTSSA
jgi:hypothetical protein